MKYFYDVCTAAKFQRPSTQHTVHAVLNRRANFTSFYLLQLNRWPTRSAVIYTRTCLEINVAFLPRCMECRRGLTMRFLSVRPSVRPSVCPSVCLSNVCIVTKRKKDMFRFLYHTKEHLSQFYEKKNGWWGRPLLSEILGQPARVGAKSPILNR